MGEGLGLLVVNTQILRVMDNSPYCEAGRPVDDDGVWERYRRYLLVNGVTDRAVPYYCRWVKEWLAKPPEPRPGLDSARVFGLSLHAKGCEDWQCRQAYQAVKRWLELGPGEKKEPEPLVVGVTWDEAIRGMKEKMITQNYSPRSIESYLEWIGRFRKFSPELPADSVSASEAVDSFLRHLALGRNLSPNSVSLARNALVWLFKRGLGMVLILQEKGGAHHGKRIPSVVSKSQVKALLQVCSDPWDLFFGLQYGCGLRLGELLELRVQEVDIERGVLTIRRGKGDKDRQLMVPKTLVVRLGEHVVRRRETWRKDLELGLAKVDLPDALGRRSPKLETSWEWQHVFGSFRPLKHPETGELRRWHPMESVVREALSNAALAAGIPGRVHPHLLRHCYATHLLEAGLSLKQIQEQMGHARLETTMVYLHVRVGISPLASPLDT